MTTSPRPFRTIALVGKKDNASVGDVVRRVAAFLAERNREILVGEDTAAYIDGVESASLTDIGRQADLVIVVGGDGTLLHTARELARPDVRILGINRGRLGFLADIGDDRMLEALDKILAGNYEDDPRFMLESEVRDADDNVIGRSLALNDVVIHKWNTARMIEFETWIDGRFVDNQRSDGMIVSTPTGSTAYALSGGGPLVCPDLNAVLLVPICPHTLSNRPIVVGGDAVIELRVGPRTEDGHAHITCDGQNSIAVRSRDRVIVRKAQHPVCLIHPAGHDHFETLRAKLSWGGNRH